MLQLVLPVPAHAARSADHAPGLRRRHPDLLPVLQGEASRGSDRAGRDNCCPCTGGLSDGAAAGFVNRARTSRVLRYMVVPARHTLPGSLPLSHLDCSYNLCSPFDYSCFNKIPFCIERQVMLFLVAIAMRTHNEGALQWRESDEDQDEVQVLVDSAARAPRGEPPRRFSR